MAYELNAAQKRAAESQSRNSLVLAGAGTGKTSTIVARANHLINSGVEPSRIQVLTFTRRSALDIQRRVSSEASRSVKKVRASTFHAWCHSLIRSNPQVFGYREWSLVDGSDQQSLFSLVRGKHKRGTFPTASDLQSAYSFARNTLVSLKEAVEYKLPDFLDDFSAIAAICVEYQKRKTNGKYLDYDDLLEIVGTRLDESAEAKSAIAAQVDHLLVDEAQDTNPLQWTILLPLVDAINLFAVGDDAQSIYGFRGADFKSIHEFKDRVTDAQVFRLQDNYRSTQEILDLSNWLLNQSTLDYNKDLRAVRGKGLLPRYELFRNPFDEAETIVDEIQDKHQAETNPWNDNLILCRTNFQARPIEAELLERKIPYVFIGGTKLLESAHVKDLLAVLRVIANPFDELGWARFLMMYPGVGEVRSSKIVDNVLRLAAKNDISGNTVPVAAPKVYPLRTLTQNPLMPEAAVDVLEAVWKVRGEVATAISTALGHLESLLENKYQHEHWDARKRDFDSLIALAEGRSGILEFVEEYLIDPIHVSQIRPGDSDSVVISTIHSAKGMEAKRVFVTGVHPGNFPHERSVGKQSEIEEERRVLYVALTRAENELILTGQLRSSLSYGQVPNETEDDLIGDGDYANLLFFLADMPNSFVSRTVVGSTGGHNRSDADAVASKDASPLKLGPRISESKKFEISREHFERIAELLREAIPGLVVEVVESSPRGKTSQGFEILVPEFILGRGSRSNRFKGLRFSSYRGDWHWETLELISDEPGPGNAVGHVGGYDHSEGYGQPVYVPISTPPAETVQSFLEPHGPLSPG